MTTPSVKNSINRSPLRLAFLLIPLAFSCFVLSGTATAAPGGNTSLGAQALQSNTTGSADTALGYRALYQNTTGSFNAAAGNNALYSNTTGEANTATGYLTLFSNTTGSQQTAYGFQALYANTSGTSNTAIGFNTLRFNTSGSNNTATGNSALLNNTTGYENTGNGFQALFSNTTGFFNTAVGDVALYSNTTGDRNTAIGSNALYSNTTGYWNTATGRGALGNNTTGYFNTAAGVAALLSNTTGAGNTANGFAALQNNTGNLNTAFGNTTLFHNSTGSSNIALGPIAGDLTTGDNNIAIGNLGVAAESNTIRIGTEVAVTDEFGILHPAHTATYIAGIYGRTTSDVGSTVPVYVDMNGNLGTAASSGRFKTEIKPMDNNSDVLLALKPVTFQYKGDGKATPQFGLIAEEVAKVNPDLVVRDAKGEIYTVRYEAVNAMLLNEFLKEHRAVQELKSTVQKQQNDFQSKLAEQQKQIKALTTGLQKVSDQLELNKPAPQMVGNDR